MKLGKAFLLAYAHKESLFLSLCVFCSAMSIILFIYLSLFDAVGAEGVENEDGIKKGFVQPPPNDTFLEKCVDSKPNSIFN